MLSAMENKDRVICSQESQLRSQQPTKHLQSKSSKCFDLRARYSHSREWRWVQVAKQQAQFAVARFPSHAIVVERHRKFICFLKMQQSFKSSENFVRIFRNRLRLQNRLQCIQIRLLRLCCFLPLTMHENWISILVEFADVTTAMQMK